MVLRPVDGERTARRKHEHGRLAGGDYGFQELLLPARKTEVVAVAAANMTASPQAFTVKSVTVAGTKAHTNTVASATVTNTVTLAKGEWLLPGTVVWAEGAGSTNAAVWVYVER